MVKVTLDDVVLADSDATIVVEGNHYFPPDAVKREYFKDSSNHTFCPWKGYPFKSTYDSDIYLLQRIGTHRTTP
jgi:uncharacterized protein (DUF427 family)